MFSDSVGLNVGGSSEATRSATVDVGRAFSLLTRVCQWLLSQPTRYVQMTEPAVSTPELACPNPVVL